MCAFLSMAVRASGVVPKQAIKGRKHAIKIAVLAVVFVASVVGTGISCRSHLGFPVRIFTQIINIQVVSSGQQPLGDVCFVLKSCTYARITHTAVNVVST